MVLVWEHLIQVLLLTAIQAFSPDEVECPDKLHPHIMSREYWVPFDSPHRAWRTLPWRYFEIKPSSIPEAGLGVFSTKFIPRNTWLGEYDGEIISADLIKHANLLVYAWDSYNDDEVTHYVDAEDTRRSNWLRFINTPTRGSDENVQSHYCCGKIFYRTVKTLHPGQELFVYYGDYYAKRLGIYNQYYNS